MTPKIKAILAFMALGAVFSVLALANSFNFGGPTLVNLKLAALDVVDNDWDNDGLTNKEESYWNTDPYNPDTSGDGYLDGEAVASGHDPLTGAKLPSRDNLTHKMSALTLAGLYEGSLNLDDPNLGSSLNSLVSVILDDAKITLNTNLSETNLRLVSSDVKNQEIYTKEFFKIFEEVVKTYLDQIRKLEGNLNTVGNTGFNDIKVINSFKNDSIQYRELLNDLSNIAVPQNWKSHHISAMKLTGNFTEASVSVTFGQNDPIRALVALNQLVILSDVLLDVSEAYATMAKENNLEFNMSIK